MQHKTQITAEFWLCETTTASLVQITTLLRDGEAYNENFQGWDIASICVFNFPSRVQMKIGITHC